VFSFYKKGSAMNLSKFSEINRLRCESPHGFNHDLSSWSTSDWMTATMGELGEAANVVKKLNRVRDGIPGNDETEAELRAKLGRELADTFIYLDLLAQSVGLNLADIVTETFDAKSAKIGSGYFAGTID
jgi:NTP pyrophosphatase (non-canonical NTP hydrolase)